MSANIYQMVDKDGNKQYPVTSTEAIGMSGGSGNLKDYLNKSTTEFNVSAFFPTGGTSGSNKYDLASAIGKVPAELRIAGLKVSFLNSAGKPESWKFQGSSWVVANFIKESSGGNKILEWKGDTVTTRKLVALSERKGGMQISYTPDGENWINEQYIGTSFADTEWGLDRNWIKIPDYMNVTTIDVVSSLLTHKKAGDLFVISPGQIGSDGRVSNISGYDNICTQLIDINLLIGITISGLWNGILDRALSDAIYDENFDFLDTITTTIVNGKAQITIEESIFEQYPTAKYIRLVTTNSLKSEVKFSPDFWDTHSQVQTNKTNIEQNSTDIRQLQTNVANKDDVVLGGNRLYDADWELGWIDGSTGELNPKYDSNVSAMHIQINPNTEYYLRFVSRNFDKTFFYDSEKKPIRKIISDDYTFIKEDLFAHYKIKTPENAYYISLCRQGSSANVGKTGNNYILARTSYDLYLPKENFTKSAASYGNIQGIAPTVRMSPNLLDMDRCTKEHGWGSNGYTLSSTYSDRDASHDIFVKPNTKYWYINGGLCSLITDSRYINYCWVMDEYQINIGALSDYLQEDGSFLMPENAAIVRLSVPRIFSYVAFSEIKAWTPYGNIGEANLILNSPFLGLTGAVLGDSTTEGGQWAFYVFRKLGMLAKACSIGGTKVGGSATNAMCTDARIDTIPEDSKLIIFAGGANDVTTVPIGTINDEHTSDTFYGAYQLMLDKAYKRCPTARMVIANLIYNNSNREENEEYREVIRRIGKKYHYPVIDMCDNAGINEYNYKQFSRTQYETGIWDNIHKNEIGNMRLANVFLAGFFAQVGGLGSFIENFVVVPVPSYPEKASFTIKPTPSDATVTIGGENVKTKVVELNTPIEWSVSKNGYVTQSGTETLTYSDLTTEVVLQAIG